MKFNKWTLGLAALGVVSLASVAKAEDTTALQTALGSTVISGYVDTSVIWRAGTQTQGAGGAPAPRGFAPATGALPLRSFDGNGKQDGFNLNVVKLTIEKPLDDAQWSAGYKVDLLFGPDAAGFNTSAAGGVGGVVAPAVSDFSMKQAYIALRAPVGNGLDFKIGTFDTIIGYEVFEAGNNPNYGRSYGWAMEPTQHTGVLMSYKFADWVSVSAGIANTAASGINAGAFRPGLPATQNVSETEKTYMAAVAFTAPESWGGFAGSSLYAGVVDGLGGAGTVGSDTTWLYAGLTLNTPLKGLTFGVAYDQVLTGNWTAFAAAGRGAGTSVNTGPYAYAIAGYVGWQATEKLKINTRIDYAKATSGTWYGVFGGAAGFAESDPQNQLISVTETIDYSLWANVISRVELRWDHELTGQHATSGAGFNAGPFGFDDRNAFTVALNFIYKF